MADDEAIEKKDAWRPKGFFGRLVSRFAQGHKRKSFVKNEQEPLVELGAASVHQSPLDQACDQFMARIESLSIEEPWEDDPGEVARYKEAMDLWSGLAKGAIQKSRQSMISAVKAGVVDESVFAGAVVESLTENLGSWDARKQASLLFELGWEKDKVHDGCMRKIDEPERWHSCKLKAYGSRASESLADLAVFAKVMQRAADLALGNWPKFTEENPGQFHWSETNNFASDDGVWLKSNGEYLSPWDELPKGTLAEPAIGMLVNRLGGLPISWLGKHKDPRVAALVGDYAKHWKVTGVKWHGKSMLVERSAKPVTNNASV